MADRAAEPVTTPPIRAEIGANRLELIESGQARLHTLIEAIAGAEHSIKMLMYMFNPDHVGDEVRDALVAAARRGVRVRLLVDGFGSAAPPKFFDNLDESGGQYCVFNPSWGRRYFVRNHQKLVVVDDRIALIGGAKIDDNYLLDPGGGHGA